MKTPLRHALPAAFVAASLSPSLFAQINVSALTQAGNVYTYSQNFNDLPTTAGALTLNDLNTAVGPGWFFALGSTTGTDATFSAITGDGVLSSSSIPTVRNYGHATTNTTDRALGLYVGTGSSQASGAMGMVFTNNTGNALSSFTLSYTGEMWRQAGAGTLDFSYQIVSTFNAASFNIRTATGWIQPAANALDFSSPSTSGGAGVDGNATANRTSISGTVTFGTPLAANEYLIIRWHHDTKAGLAVDDMTLSLTAIPEPSAFAGFAGLAALGTALRRRRR
jgi:hypothetical protein